MADLFVCHGAGNRQIALGIAQRLERCTGTNVWLEECSPEKTVAAAWEEGLSAHGILMLLSPEVVPRLTREAWEGVLEHSGGMASPPVACLLTTSCAYPKLLERRCFWRWSDENTGLLRELERWALSLHGEKEQRGFEAARLPGFRGQQESLEWLWEALVDEPGVALLVNPTAGSGKTSLAQEFARTAHEHFREVLWIACGERSEASLAGELAWRLGISIERDAMDALGQIRSLLEEHRLLLVLDDVAAAPPVLVSAEGRSSILMTARSINWNPPRHLRILPVEAEEHGETKAAEIAGEALQLCQAARVCARNGFPISLAARIAKLGEGPRRQASERLVNAGLLVPLDAAGRWFRWSITPDGGELPHQRHAEALLSIFGEWRANPEQCQDLLTEWEAAYTWALEKGWELAGPLAQRGFGLLKWRGRLGEAAEVMERLRQAAFLRREWMLVEECAWELSWIQGGNGGLRQGALHGGQLGFDFL